MLNHNYQHLFDMVPIIFNDRLQSGVESFTEGTHHILAKSSPIFVTISTSTGPPNQRVFCRLCCLR